MTKAEVTETALLSMVDELGDLEAELAPVRAKLARTDALRRAMRAIYENADHALSYEIVGERFRAVVGPCGNQTSVNIALLQKLVGPTAFLTVASVSLKAIGEKFGAVTSSAVTSTDQSGTRPLDVYPRMEADKKKKR